MFIPSEETIEKLLPNISSIQAIAQGGQKRVLKAVHQQHGDVVVKLIIDSSSDERIKREIEIATSYSFSNVPKIFDWGYIEYESSRILFLVEEYIAGVTLRRYLNDNGKLPLNMALNLLETLLITATELESKRLVHRDIKPENIIVSSSSAFYLIDFGIARQLDSPSLTFTKAHFGPHSPGYSAPEQFRNQKKEIDIRADLFSIGVVVYESISGKHPFIEDCKHPLDVLLRTEAINPIPFSIPGDSQRQLIGFILILMDKFSSRRPKSAKTALDWYYALLPTVRVEEA